MKKKLKVSAAVGCPACLGSGHFECEDCSDYDEVDELRKLYDYMTKNVAKRSRPPAKLLDILERIKISRGD